MPASEQDETPPSAVTLDERIDNILGTNGDHTIANISREDLIAKITRLREERAAKGLPTLDSTGIVLRKCGRVKARKKAHQHQCENCAAVFDCALGEGCTWNKHTPVCGACTPACLADFRETWTGKETPSATDTPTAN